MNQNTKFRNFNTLIPNNGFQCINFGSFLFFFTISDFVSLFIDFWFSQLIFVFKHEF